MSKIYVCDVAHMDAASPLYAVLAPDETELQKASFRAAAKFSNVYKGRASTSSVHDNPREVCYDADGYGSVKITRYVVADDRAEQGRLDDILDFSNGSEWTEIPPDLSVDYDPITVAEFRMVIQMAGDGRLSLLWRGNIEGTKFETDSIPIDAINDFLPDEEEETT